jgi:hypothetical protein
MILLQNILINQVLSPNRNHLSDQMQFQIMLNNIIYKIRLCISKLGLYHFQFSTCS